MYDKTEASDTPASVSIRPAEIKTFIVRLAVATTADELGQDKVVSYRFSFSFLFFFFFLILFNY